MLWQALVTQEGKGLNSLTLLILYVIAWTIDSDRQTYRQTYRQTDRLGVSQGVMASLCQEGKG